MTSDNVTRTNLGQTEALSSTSQALNLQVTRLQALLGEFHVGNAHAGRELELDAESGAAHFVANRLLRSH